jgi:iron complex outermembrane receptor protein
MQRALRICLSLLFISDLAFGQTSLNIGGRVTDAAHRPIQRVTVRILNEDHEAVTDTAGTFGISIPVQQGSYTLHFSKSGYAGTYASLSVSTVDSLEATAGQINLPEVVLKESGTALDEVLVTAEKNESQLQAVPLGVTVLNAQAITDYRLWNISDLTGLAPTLFTAAPGDNRSVISIRGITTTSYDPAVAVYVDGVAQFGLDTYLSELTEPERIEILRGPQSTLYGRNTMGGVINIITKQPSMKKSAFAEATAGNYGMQRYRAGFKTPFGKRLLFGASFLGSKLDGYYTNDNDGSRFDKQSLFAGNYFLKLLPGAGRWSATLNVKHQAARNHGAFPLVYGTEAALAHPFHVTLNAAPLMRDNTLNASLSLHHNCRSFQLHSQTAWQSNNRHYTGAIDGDFSPADGIGVYNDYGKSWNKVQVATQEIRISSPAGASDRAISWTAGTYLFHQRSPVKQATVFGADAIAFGAPDSLFRIVNTSTSINQGAALFGQLTIPVTSRLKITGGLRYDYQRSSLSLRSDYQSDNGSGAAFPIQEDTAGSGSYSAVSPRLSLLYTIRNRTTGYLNYSRGYRTGGLTQLSADPSQPALSPFLPEYSNNWEAGLRRNLLSNRLQLALTGFYILLNDLQVPALVLPAAVTITRNTGALESKGIEAEASAALLKGLSARYSFGYTDARFTSMRLPASGTETDYSGNRQLFTPDVTSSLALQYSLRLVEHRKLDVFLRGEWLYLGQHYFDVANTISQTPYHLFNTRCGLRLPTAELALWMRNIGDTRYVDYSYDFGAVHLGNPRTYGVTLSVRTD